MNEYKLIRFGFRSKLIKKYARSIKNLYMAQDNISIFAYQFPYIVIVKNSQVVSCIWIERTREDGNEFSIITHPDHRKKGLAERLIRELVHDKFMERIKGELFCEPVHPSIRRIIKRFKFKPEYGGSTFWEFDL